MTDRQIGTHVLRCDEKHLKDIRDIFNEAILQTTALYEELPRSEETIAAWFAKKRQDGIPIFGVEQQGTVVGFATWGTFRPYPAYSKTAEHSVYIAREYQRQGFGRLLLETIIQEATAHKLHLLVAGIDSANEASIALHRHVGFSHAGTIHEAGYKFKRWLDLEFWQRLLK
jgi:phosphinothricin acetyltransferase